MNIYEKYHEEQWFDAFSVYSDDPYKSFDHICHHYRINVIKQFLKNSSFALDVGCGSAEPFFITEDPENLVCVDLSVTALRSLRSKSFEGMLLCADAQYLPIREKVFYKSVCSETIEHVPNPSQTIKELLRTTRKESLITTPNENEWYDPTHIYIFNKKKLSETITCPHSYIRNPHRVRNSYIQLAFRKFQISRRFLILLSFLFKPSYLIVKIECASHMARKKK